MVIRHISIDCAFANKMLETVTQKEHGVTQFEFEVNNRGSNIDISECTLATYYGIKPDGHKVGVECKIDKDKGFVYLPLYLQMTTADGTLKGVLELQFAEGNVRFNGINFRVYSAPDDVEVESTDEWDILEKFLRKPEKDGKSGQVLTLDKEGNVVWANAQGGGSGGTFDYYDLTNKPSINGVELNGNKTLEDLNIKQKYTSDDIQFADGQTFQEKFDNGSLKGQDGQSGADGVTPHIGDNNNWFIGDTDTGKASKGKDGSIGIDGKSAYEIALEHGFVGTEEDWLTSLKGADGKNGIDGVNGKNGLDGHTPEKGVDYFTEADISEITSKVIAGLPKYNGEVIV